MVDPQSHHPSRATDAAAFAAADAGGFSWRRLLPGAAWRGSVGTRRSGELGRRGRSFLRYLLVIALVVAADLAAYLIQDVTGNVSAFPFYAVVIAGAWLGLGPGIVAFLLSAFFGIDFWTPARFDWDLRLEQLPSFIIFVTFALMSLAWAFERRRIHQSLETTVQQRTADLLKANAALQTEITERELAEQERERTERALRDAEADLARMMRLAAMAELAATIVHEIAQPLAAMTANGSACLRSLSRQPALLDNAREAASCIVADGHRAGDVIARVRALFNNEQPTQQVVNINDTIMRVLDLSRGAVERERVQVKTELAREVPLVMADAVQLQQVMVNLVTNAIEAMHDTGGRRRRLLVRSEIDGGDAVVVTVEDSGHGFGPEHVTHIFDSFFTTKADGIGVGLAISRSIIEAHAGSMWAAPGTRHGARVGFRLPLAAAAGREP
jgi:C4-dicarboxylate-specific signal transduction histidine kinase